MLDKKFLLNNRLIYENNMRKRRLPSEYDLFLEINGEYSELKKKYDDLRFQQKKITKLTDEAKTLKNELTEVTKNLTIIEVKLKNFLLNQPNILLEDVPEGDNENDNVVIYETNKPNSKSYPHYELIEEWSMNEEAVALSGSRFIILKKTLSKLKRALTNFMLDHNMDSGYHAYDVPYIVNESAFYHAGQFPKFKDDAFSLSNGQWLISTGEISLVSMFANKIFNEDELPKLSTTYTPCFRKEAGSASKDTKGMIRLHQFHKVELVTICKPEDSQKYQTKQLETAKMILELLHIPYRVVLLCSADTGFSSTKTYDIEMWLPGTKRYLEISSCSQCGDFQARRANIKYKNSTTNTIEYVHLLNGSSLALERLIVGFLENNYDSETHTIIIPNILREYLKKNQILVNINEKN